MRARRRYGWILPPLVLALSFLLGTSAAQAGRHRQSSSVYQTSTVQNVQPKTYSAPELDPSVAGAAAVLLGGGLLLLFDRRRRQA